MLKTFLMSRLPIASFSASNGHGRAQTGHMPTGRQGNLIVTSTKTVSEAELRKQLIEEAKKQGKPYGLYFEDISSGFAVTQRSSPQAFQVIPLVVWRVYVDGRPDELVRGVSIVGTPLAAMKRILATGDKSEVFNGECGAESGTIPVSAVAPAMLVSEMETQRQPQGTARPPILPIPGAEIAGARNQGGDNELHLARMFTLACTPLPHASLLHTVASISARPGAPAVRSASAGQQTRADAEKDPVLTAMLTELDRSMSQLQLPGFAKPFFIQYRIEEVDDFETKAEFGASEGSAHAHQRVARVTVRVGDYKTDSSGGRGDGSIELTALDNDPIALRSSLWMATDQAYKNALSAYAQKQAELKQVQTPPQADDFSHEKPVVSLGPPLALHLDEDAWARRVARASGLYRTDATAQRLRRQVFAVSGSATCSTRRPVFTPAPSPPGSSPAREPSSANRLPSFRRHSPWARRPRTACVSIAHTSRLARRLPISTPKQSSTSTPLTRSPRSPICAKRRSSKRNITARC